MIGESHAALHPGDYRHDHGHFAPEGWEEADRGICPCGEVVAWNDRTECWEPDRTMRVLVLTDYEAAAVTRSVSGLLLASVLTQLSVQNDAGLDWSPLGEEV